MNNDDGFDNLYINNIHSFNDLLPNNQDTEAGVQFQSSPILLHNSPISNLPPMSSASTSTNISLMSLSSANKDKQLFIKLDDLSPFNFKDLSEKTIPDDPQVQQLLYHFNCLVKAMEKEQSYSSKQSFLVQIPVFKGEK
ncbi:1571_t:CDS:2 [Racocetra persica]|uniref:1571_t:CDS:1 n=1 Tax=Racocetra persica TaxID=160502 RepID=A0ACA9N083_9GLOM|nr:1571_t:CDS:2 [Racocetra persica]